MINNEIRFRVSGVRMQRTTEAGSGIAEVGKKQRAKGRGDREQNKGIRFRVSGYREQITEVGSGNSEVLRFWILGFGFWIGHSFASPYFLRNWFPKLSALSFELVSHNLKLAAWNLYHPASSIQHPV
jgi:hypothetical protein